VCSLAALAHASMTSKPGARACVCARCLPVVSARVCSLAVLARIPPWPASQARTPVGSVPLVCVLSCPQFRLRWPTHDNNANVVQLKDAGVLNIKQAQHHRSADHLSQP